MLFYHFLAIKIVGVALDLWEKGEYKNSLKLIGIIFLTTMIDFSRYFIKI